MRRTWVAVVLVGACVVGPGVGTHGAGSTSGSSGETGGSETGRPTSSGVGSSGPGGTTEVEGSSSGVVSTSEVESTTGGDGTSDDSTGCSFVCDTGGLLRECDSFTQDCPEGEKCMPYADDGGNSWNNLKCVPVMGDQQVGEPCTAVESGVSGLDDCALGAMCWDTDAENHGICVELCKGSPEAPICVTPYKSCAISEVLAICLDECDPLAQDCDPSDVCVPVPSGEAFECVPDESGVEGQQHDPCETPGQCDAGMLCLEPHAAAECDANEPGCCQPFCDVGLGDGQCAGVGQECNLFFEMGMAPPGFEKVGYCAVPP